MKEDTVIKIAERFFERENIKPRRQERAGVDFIIEGKAIEIKATNSDFSSALAQFLDYALKYRGLMLIFPTDFLSNPLRIINFHLFSHLALGLANKSVELVLIAEDEHFYYLKKFGSAQVLLNDIVYQIAYQIINKKETSKEILRNLKGYTQKALEKIVKEDRFMMLRKSIIQ